MLQQRLEIQIGRLVVENNALAEQIEVLTKERDDLVKLLEPLQKKQEKENKDE